MIPMMFFYIICDHFHKNDFMSLSHLYVPTEEHESIMYTKNKIEDI